MRTCVGLGRGLWQRGQMLWRQHLGPRLLRLDRAFSVREKILIPIIILSLGIVGGVVWRSYQSERRDIEKHFLEKALILTRAFQLQVRNEQDLKDLAHRQAQIQRLFLLDPSLLRTNVYMISNGQPKVVASSDQTLIGQVAQEYDAVPFVTGQREVTEVRIDGQKALEIADPIFINGSPQASVGVYLSVAERDRALRFLLIRSMVTPLAVVLAFLAVLPVILHPLVLSRLHRLATAHRRLATGDLEVRVPGNWDGNSRDELVLLAYGFNEMAAVLQDTYRQLERQAITDGLTGLYNRRYFDEALEREMHRAQRLRYPLALLMLDLDRFKEINDQYGHTAGDKVLRAVAATLQRNLRAIDTVARYGGEEFAAILPGSDVETVHTVAQRLRLAMQRMMLQHNCWAQAIHVTVSVGVAVYLGEAATPDQLLARADEALYQAKRQGRNRVCIAT